MDKESFPIIIVLCVIGLIGLILRKKFMDAEKDENSNTSESSSPSSIEHKLDRLYDVMNHIRWIGLSIGCMLALTFIVPQCTGS